jgi:hypothetical protein
MTCVNCGRPIELVTSDYRGPLPEESHYWTHHTEFGRDTECHLTAASVHDRILLELTPEELEWLMVLTEQAADDPDDEHARNYSIVSLPDTTSLSRKVEGLSMARALGGITGQRLDRDPIDQFDENGEIP